MPVGGGPCPELAPVGTGWTLRTVAAILANPRYTGREDQILPHLAAIAILLAGAARKPVGGSRGLAQLTGPYDTAALIDRLRADGTALTYDPSSRTLRAGDHHAPAITIGTDATSTRSRQDKERRTA